MMRTAAPARARPVVPPYAFVATRPLLRLHRGSWAIGLILLLWPLEIGPEEPPAPGPKPAPAAPAPPAPATPHPQAKERATLPAFGTQKDDPIDREAFIASFRRQARAEALPCLLQGRPSPASLHVAATLLKSGQLKNLRPIGTGTSFPDCLAPAVAKMDFAPLAAPLTADAQELQWRIDW